MTGATTKNVVYKSLRPSQILGSEKMVTCVIDVLSEEYLNPFSVSLDENLYNLSSSVPVEDELANKILCTEQKGSEIYGCFANERLLSGGTKNFHDPLPRNKVYSFKSTSKNILRKTTENVLLKSIETYLDCWCDFLYAVDNLLVLKCSSLPSITNTFKHSNTSWGKTRSYQKQADGCDLEENEKSTKTC